MVLSVLARMDESMAQVQHAREVDPLAPYPYAMTGVCLLALGRAAESERYFDQARAFESGNTLALWGAGLALMALGRHDEAVAILEEANTPSHRGGFIHGSLGWALAVAGRVDEARAVLEELHARPAPAPTVVAEAWLLAALGDAEAGWEVLERAEKECQAMLAYAATPGFDPFRADPRFPALVERLGLPTGKKG
jgi:tetratricopeptide (TPR) repeat protein